MVSRDVDDMLGLFQHYVVPNSDHDIELRKLQL